MLELNSLQHLHSTELNDAERRENLTVIFDALKAVDDASAASLLTVDMLMNPHAHKSAVVWSIRHLLAERDARLASLPPPAASEEKKRPALGKRLELSASTSTRLRSESGDNPKAGAALDPLLWFGDDDKSALVIAVQLFLATTELNSDKVPQTQDQLIDLVRTRQPALPVVHPISLLCHRAQITFQPFDYVLPTQCCRFLKA